MILERFGRLAGREKAGLVLAGVFFSALLVKIWVVQPVIDRCRELDVQSVTRRGDVMENEGILGTREQVSREYETIRGLLGEVASSDEAIAGVKGEIDDLARRTGVSVQSMEHREPARTVYGEEYSVVIGSLETEVKNLLAFLHEIQSSPGMLRVTKLSLSPGRSKGMLKGSATVTKMMIPAGN